MSKEGEGMIKEDKPNFILVEIKLYENGELSVNSPRLGDTMFMCGLLEMAKAICFQYKANQANIIKPKGGIMNFARKRFHA